MRRSKLVFIILAVIFLIILALIAMDFSSKTSFPGKKNVDSVDTTNGPIHNEISP